MKVVWCDDFARFDPVDGGILAEEGQQALAPPVNAESARNAFASFQLLVGPLEKSDSVSVRPRALKGPRDTELGEGAFDAYVCWYCAHEGRWYPEVLVPQRLTGGSTPAFRRHNAVPGQRFAGIWVDVFVPAGTAPGPYSGGVEVRAGAETALVGLNVLVHEAVLPPDCCLDVSLNNYADSISPGWPDLAASADPLSTGRYVRIEHGVFRAAHDHRMFIHYMPYGHSGYVYPGFAPPLTGEGPAKKVMDWSSWDRHFGPYFDGSVFSSTRRGPVPVKRFYLPLNLCWPADFLKFGQPGYEAEWHAVGTQMVDHFRAKGWTGTRFDMFLNHKQRFRFFPWDTEEVRFLEDNEIHRYFRTLWEGTFDRASTRPVTFDYTLGTTWSYGWDIRSDLADFIDVFIAGTTWCGWYREETPRLHAKGRQIWACSHSGSIPTSLRAPAFLPLLMWMQDIDGYMPHWCSIGGWGDDPWRKPSGAGSSIFLYPGSEFGCDDTFASLRLKTQRNALQTVDLLQMAAGKASKGKPAIRAAVNRLLGVSAGAWTIKRPSFADRKPPKDWTGTDFATEEPPLAGWARFETDRYRRLRAAALRLASEGRQ